MTWISKHPPIYVWASDYWHNERDGLTYMPDIAKRVWVSGDNKVPMQNKTVLMDK